jgi:hypothetical protein
MEAKAIADPEAPARPSPSPAAPEAPYRRAWRWLRSSPFVFSLLICIALALLSDALLATVPSYDPWSWIVWGKELTDPHLNFTVGGGPSWKPLPVMFTTVYSLFGGVAPTLWVITARIGGFMAFAGAFRLAWVLTVRVGYRRAAWVAGVVAVLGVALTQDFAYYMFRGTSEPFLVAAALWSVERLIAGKRRQAFILGVVLAWMRPESWPFLFAFGAWLFWKEPRSRWLVVAGLIAVPAAWFGPPWIGDHQPFIAATHAKDYNGHLGKHPILEVLRRGADLQTVPVLILALIGVAITWLRERDRMILWIAAGVVGWWVLVVGMTKDGYPGLERFYLPAAALTCVLAGVGVVRIGAEAAGVARRLGLGTSALRPVAIGAGVVVVALTVPFVTGRIDTARAQRHIAAQAEARLAALGAAVAAVGGHHAVYPCKDSFVAVNHSMATALAWKLHVTLGGVGTSMRHPGVLFVGPHDSIDGGPARISHRLDRIELLKTVGPWRVYRVWRAGHSLACVGT